MQILDSLHIKIIQKRRCKNEVFTKHYPNDNLRILWYFSKWPISRQPALRNVPENWGAQFEWLLFYKLLSCCIKDTIPVVRDSEDIHQDMELNFQGNIHCDPKVVHVQVKFSVLNLNHLFWF